MSKWLQPTSGTRRGLLLESILLRAAVPGDIAGVRILGLGGSMSEGREG